MSNDQWGGPGSGYGQGPGGPGPHWGQPGGPAPQGGTGSQGGYGHPGAYGPPSGPGPQGGPSFPAYQPHDPKQKKATPIVIGAIIGVGAMLGAIVGFGVWAGRDTPNKGVDRYFAALNSTYSQNLADEVVNAPSATELKEAKDLALGQRGKYAVVKVAMSGMNAQVDYTIDGRSESIQLEMRKVDGKYKVVDGFSKLTVKAPTGLDFSLGYGNSNIVGKTIPLYPGTYELRGTADSTVSTLYYTIKNGKTITLKPGEKKDHDIQVELSKSGVESAQRAVSSAFSKCTTSKDPAPQGCPFSVPAPADRGGQYANWEVEGGRAYRVAESASVDVKQPLNEVCMTFNAQVSYQYYTANYDKRTVKAPQERFTACADITQRTPTATWK